MSVEEIQCRSEVKQENLSSSEGLRTYRRRSKRKRTGESSYPQENVTVEVDYTIPGRWKCRDIGWEHGKIMNGNKNHWKCNWCSYCGLSGGVTRLKKHLAGGWYIKPCPKVPEHVASMMNNNLLEIKKKRMMREREQEIFNLKNLESPHLDVSVDKVHEQIGSGMLESSEVEQCGRASKFSKTCNQEVKDLYTESKTATRQLNNVEAKATMEPCDAANAYDQDGFSIRERHWRTVLEDILQLPDVRKGGGIRSSISDALICGPHIGKSKMDFSKYTAEPKDRFESHCVVLGQSRQADMSANAQIDGIETITYDHIDRSANKLKHQDVLCNILCSDEFVLLCNLLYGNFQGCKIDNLFDINHINSNMKTGAYEQSPGLFNHEMQQMWRKLKNIGEEMVLLAGSLLNMSHGIDQKQVREQVADPLVHETCTKKCEENHQVSLVPNSNDSCGERHLPSCESNSFVKPDQTEASGQYKACKCKKCGTQADAERSLICDQCEAVYHFSCVEPSVQEIPTISWYCASCAKDNMKKSPEFPVNSNTQESLHNNCVVCERLEFSNIEEMQENGRTIMADGSREGSVSSMESDDEPLEPSRTALSHLCKQCGTCEDEDRRFLVCGHNQCPYKYYHIRCLKSNQIASLQQLGRDIWYCPSCLCRSCFLNNDDDKIVLCDGCDEAYHTYCMRPPRASIPKGQWYCIQCNIAKAKEGMRRYEQWVLQQHGRKDGKQANEENRSMDVLLCAVEKLSSEGNLVAGKREV